MGNILLTSVFVLVLLPQLSFAQSTQSADDQAKAFYAQQVQEREAYIKAHPDEMAQRDIESKKMYAEAAKARAEYIKQHPDEIAKQDQEAKATFAKQAQEREKARREGATAFNIPSINPPTAVATEPAPTPTPSSNPSTEPTTPPTSSTNPSTEPSKT